MKKRIFLAKLPIDKVSLETVVSHLFSLLEPKGQKPKMVFYLNAYTVNLAFKDKNYAKAIRAADLVYADGWGPVWAGKVLGYQLPGRLTTADFFDDFCQKAKENNLSLFLLGSCSETIKKTAKNLKKEFKNLKIVGFHHGFLNQSKSKKVISLINRSQPDFLIIGLGSPKQEKWLFNHLDQLQIKVGWCVGGLFEYLAKTKPKCPRWLGDLGFEWLFRLLAEPKRLWRRYLISGPEFLFRLVRSKLNL